MKKWYLSVNNFFISASEKVTSISDLNQPKVFSASEKVIQASKSWYRW